MAALFDHFTMTVHCNNLSSKNATFLLASLIKIHFIFFFTFSIYQKIINNYKFWSKVKTLEDSTLR